MPDAPTRPLSDLLPLVVPHVATAPRPAIEQALRLSAIEWCERTRCWRHITTLAIDARRKAVAAPPYATIHRIESARWNGEYDLTPVQFTQTDIIEGEDADSAPPAYLTQVSPNEVSVHPFEEGTLTLSAFLKPRSAPQPGTGYGDDPADPLASSWNVVPEHVLIQSGEDVAAGALYRMMMTPGKDWTNFELGADHRARFNIAANDAYGREMRGQQRAPVRTTPIWM